MTTPIPHPTRPHPSIISASMEGKMELFERMTKDVKLVYRQPPKLDPKLRTRVELDPSGANHPTGGPNGGLPRVLAIKGPKEPIDPETDLPFQEIETSGLDLALEKLVEFSDLITGELARCKIDPTGLEAAFVRPYVARRINLGSTPDDIKRMVDFAVVAMNKIKPILDADQAELEASAREWNAYEDALRAAEAAAEAAGQ